MEKFKILFLCFVISIQLQSQNLESIFWLSQDSIEWESISVFDELGVDFPYKFGQMIEQREIRNYEAKNFKRKNKKSYISKIAYFETLPLKNIKFFLTPLGFAKINEFLTNYGEFVSSDYDQVLNVDIKTFLHKGLKYSLSKSSNHTGLFFEPSLIIESIKFTPFEYSKDDFNKTLIIKAPATCKTISNYNKYSLNSQFSIINNEIITLELNLTSSEYNNISKLLILKPDGEVIELLPIDSKSNYYTGNIINRHISTSVFVISNNIIDLFSNITNLKFRVEGSSYNVDFKLSVLDQIYYNKILKSSQI
jgi:hypothetical protein